MSDEEPGTVHIGSRGSVRDNLREIYEYRSTFYSLVRNQLFGRYKNSILGFAWHFINPLIMMVVYYVAFTTIRTGGAIPDRWLFMAAALFGFNYLTGALTGGCSCILGNASTVKKMYFPREILILSQATTNFIITLIGYAFVIAAAVIIGHHLDYLALLFIFPLLLLTFLFGVGIMLITSSITVYVRDFQYALGSISMVFFFMTPMFYIAEEAKGLLADVIWWNPFTYFVELYHDILYWGQSPHLTYVLVCTALTAVVLIAGYLIFDRLKHGFTERL